MSNPPKKKQKLTMNRSGWDHWFPYNHEVLPNIIMDILVEYDGRKFEESPEEFSRLNMTKLDCWSEREFVTIDHQARGIKQREHLDHFLKDFNEGLGFLLAYNDKFAHTALESTSKYTLRNGVSYVQDKYEYYARQYNYCDRNFRNFG